MSETASASDDEPGCYAPSWQLGLRGSLKKIAEWLRPALIASLFLLLTWLVILFNRNTGGIVYDSVGFHIPQVNMFMRNPFAIFSYPAWTPTTPGHHLALAWLMRALGYVEVDQHTLALRLANSLISSVSVLITAIGSLRLTRDTYASAAVVAPLAGSSYLLGSAAFVSTDGGALAFFTIIIFLLIFHPTARAAFALALAALVSWRQLYLPVGLAIAMRQLVQPDWSLVRCAREQLLTVALVLGPSLILFGLWYLHWGGLITPEYQSLYTSGFQPAVVVQGLALTGLLGFCFAPWLVAPLRSATKAQAIALGAGSFAVALLFWALGPTNLDTAAGRFGSIIWIISEHSYSIFQRSLVLLLLSWLGAYAIVAMFWHAKKEQYFPSESLCLLLYLCGYSAQVFAYQRYVEPQILVVFAFFASRHQFANKWLYAVPAVGGLMLVATSIIRAMGVLPPH